MILPSCIGKAIARMPVKQPVQWNVIKAEMTGNTYSYEYFLLLVVGDTRWAPTSY